MANAKQVAQLKQSVEEWNQWRYDHPNRESNLSNADLSGADLVGADLHYADLIGADLRCANLSGANLIGANLIGANLNVAKLVGTDFRRANLIGTYLRRADLSDANLTQADFRRANLIGTYLRRADLSDANLSGAHLSDANLSDAKLIRTKLFNADLSGTDLIGTELVDTDLRHANLCGSNLRSTIFRGKIDLRLAKGLAEINHGGPSLVELHSLQLPQDGSALHFLRGVGIPDEWIDFYRATMMHPVQYYSCFLCYSSTDEGIAKRLHADLQANSVRCWFAPHDLNPGNYIRKEIDQAIHLQDKLLLILSEHAINSGWVDYEVELALAREIRQQREILFPIRLDNEALQSASNWATTLQATRHIGDFTNWTDTQTYQHIFDRLLRDLKKADES